MSHELYDMMMTAPMQYPRSADPSNDSGATYVKRTAHVVVEVSWMEDEDTGSSTFEQLAEKEVEGKLRAAGIDWQVIEANEV